MWRVLITLTSLTSILLLQRSSIILFKRQICLVSVTLWKPIWYFSHDGSTWLFYKERKCGLFRVKFIHIFKAQSKGLQSFFTCLTWTFWHWLRNSIVLIWKFRRKVHKYFSRVEKSFDENVPLLKTFLKKLENPSTTCVISSNWFNLIDSLSDLRKWINFKKCTLYRNEDFDL